MELKNWPETPREYYNSLRDLLVFIRSVERDNIVHPDVQDDLQDAKRMFDILANAAIGKFRLDGADGFREWFTSLGKPTG